MGIRIKQYKLPINTLEFQEKAIDVQKALGDLSLKTREVNSYTFREVTNQKIRNQIDAVNAISNLIASHVIDESKDEVGVEQKFKPVFTDQERQILKDKVLRLLE